MSVFLVAMVCSIASGGTIYGVAAVPPTHATNPNPSDGAVDVPVDANLSWVRGEVAIQDEVYFGTDPCALPKVATIPSAALPPLYDPPADLVASTTYYWQIVEVNGPNEYPGPVWSFRTIPGEAQCDYPEDGAMIPGDIPPEEPGILYTELIFIPGPTAVRHTGYFSKVRDEVANRAEVAKIPTPIWIPFPPYTYIVGGPRFPYENLIRGQVYYWTDDETDSFDNTFFGDVWEFTIHPYEAFNPSPPNEAIYIDTDVLLSWLEGYGAQKHDVFFGTNWEDVNNAYFTYSVHNSSPEYVDTTDVGVLSYQMNGLDPETRYYWRIDEVHGRFPPSVGTIYRGDVWCFTTVGGEAQCDYPEDGAVIPGDYYDSFLYTELIYIPGPTAVRHTGYLSKVRDEVANRAEVAKLISPPFCGCSCWPENTFYAGHPGYYPYESLIRGQVYYWTVDETDSFDNTFFGDVWEFTVHPYEAFEPSPPNEAVFIETDVLLSWLAGYGAASHDVFIGASWEDVNNAYFSFGGSSPEYVDTTDAGILEWQCSGLPTDTKIYWRIDGVQSRFPPSVGTVYKGDVWCFTTMPRRICVDVDAAGANNGAGWENAYKFLQDALIDANSALKPVEIWVAEGIYTPDSNSADPNGSGDRTATFQLINGVTLKGGYAGFGEANPDARDIELYETTLSGDLDGNDEPNFVNYEENSYHVVTGSGTDSSAVLDGFTITAGNANEDYPSQHANGGGMYNYTGSPTVTNCIFTGNRAGYGGGMLNSFSNPTITNCTFSGNTAGSGGGMSNWENSNLTVSNCIFSNNTSANHGGGMYNYDSSPIVTNSSFIGNSASFAGGGMVNSNDSNSTVTNCTFIGNSVSNSGGGMGNFESDPFVINCILWGDTPDEIWLESGTLVITYSDVQSGIGQSWFGTGCIDVDPCFVDAAAGNLRLSSDSPCIDTGYNNAPNLPDTDMDGHPRIIDGDCNETDVVDMGAYEFNYAYMGDFDYDCSVDFVDFSIFGLAWMTKPGDAQWNRFCDISKPSDNYIDWLDAVIVCDNWLSEVP